MSGSSVDLANRTDTHETHERPIARPTCWSCRHLLSPGERTCDAFPDGIPYAIWAGKHDRSMPVPGDGGITFERITEADADELGRRQDEASASEARPRSSVAALSTEH